MTISQKSSRRREKELWKGRAKKTEQEKEANSTWATCVQNI